MRFLVDMGVDVRVAEWLRSEGHDATHLRDQGLQRLPNGEIFQKAASEKRTVLKESAAALEKNAVISVQEGRHRIRYFPAET